MPRSTLRGVFLLSAAFLAAGHAGAVEGDGDLAASDKDQSHVDFSVGGTDEGYDQALISISTAPGAAYTVEAHLLPGECAAEVLAGGTTAEDGVDACGVGTDMGDRHVDFRISIHPDGGVVVSGEEIAVCDPAEGCRVSLAWCSGNGSVTVHVEDASGAIVAAQYVLGEAPSEIRIDAAEVRALSVTSQ